MSIKQIHLCKAESKVKLSKAYSIFFLKRRTAYNTVKNSGDFGRLLVHRISAVSVTLLGQVPGLTKLSFSHCTKEIRYNHHSTAYNCSLHILIFTLSFLTFCCPTIYEDSKGHSLIANR